MNLTRLSERTEALLHMGAKTTGSFTEGYHYIVEQLYCDEAEKIWQFCQWIDKVIGGAGPANINTLWNAFNHPGDEALQEQAVQIKRRIESFKHLC